MHGPLRWTFVVPSLGRPAGGLVVLYELANALVAGEGNRVHMVHLPTDEGRLGSLEEIPWFGFDPAITHRFASALDAAELPDADVVLYTVMVVDLCLRVPHDPAAARLLVDLQSDGGPFGRPILFLQALGIFPQETEVRALQGSGPKVSVAAWIARNLARAGLPAAQVAHVPNGIDHRTFRAAQPIEGRPRRVAMNFNPHPLKNMDGGIAALERIERELGVPAVLFGTRFPATRPTGEMRFVHAPQQRQLADEILSGSSVYLQPSTHEGFGLSAIEAMACGCALVTTSNGGSLDYARDGETAVVCDADVDAMVDALRDLLEDEPRRVEIATRGRAFVERFRWESSGHQLADVARSYLTDPDRFRRDPDLVLDEAALYRLD